MFLKKRMKKNQLVKRTKLDRKHMYCKLISSINNQFLNIHPFTMQSCNFFY